ncbi:curlin [Pelagibacterium sp.]|uniref:curlin n=1 Tax=Pelagibacterium sp. TaxID=1967288 RepID=UPI003A8ED111
MGRNIKTLKAAGLALVIGLGTLSAPAVAGQLSINLNPANAEQRQMMQTGLGLYALYNGIQSGSITQSGFDNIAGLSQAGGGNLGVVHQEGNNHNGTLNQHGGNNSYGLFQFGEGTSAHVDQSGGQSGLGFVFGW